MTRSLKTTRSVVATACCVLVFSFLGCERKAPPEAAPAVDPTSPEARMKDPVYRQKLDDLNAARKPLLRARAQILSEMEALRGKVRDELAAAGGAAASPDAARVEAALAARPAWASLTNRLAAAEAALEAHRRRVAETIRRRLTVPKADGANGQNGKKN